LAPNSFDWVFSGFLDASDSSFNERLSGEKFYSNRFSVSSNGERMYLNGVYDKGFNLKGDYSTSKYNFSVGLAPDGSKLYLIKAADGEIYVHSITDAASYDQSSIITLPQTYRYNSVPKSVITPDGNTMLLYGGSISSIQESRSLIFIPL
jgi:hypothetical protein